MPGSLSDYLEGKLMDHILGNTAFTAPATVHMALFTVSPSDTGGGTEVSGGSYARVAITNNTTNWPNFSAGLKSSGTAINFPTPTADWGTVVAWGLFDAASAGNLLFWGPLGGLPKQFIADVDDSITSNSHGFSDGQKVRVEALTNVNLPSGLSANTDYFVRDSAANTFKLAATQGGAAINITADGAGWVYLWSGQQIVSGNTVSFASGDVDIALD